nr:aldehyde dehydrogenase family 2 member C4-like [Tanacetum cinerariifolium]
PIYERLGVKIFGLGFLTSLIFIFFVGIFASSWMGATVFWVNNSSVGEASTAAAAPEAGVPDGVINVVNGFGSTAGAAISSHMDIDAVTFYFLLVNITSICFAIQLMRYQSRLLLRVPPKVRRTVMQAATESNLKPVSLELGGKSPFIVFDDAYIEKPAEIVVLGNLSNKGEVCVAGSRVFVHEGIYDAFVMELEVTVKN